MQDFSDMDSPNPGIASRPVHNQPHDEVRLAAGFTRRHSYRGVGGRGVCMWVEPVFVSEILNLVLIYG